MFAESVRVGGSRRRHFGALTNPKFGQSGLVRWFVQFFDGSFYRLAFLGMQRNRALADIVPKLLFIGAQTTWSAALHSSSPIAISWAVQ